METLRSRNETQSEFAELLESLQPRQWNAPTACAGWSVKDLVVHLLDGSQRRLSICRDGNALAFVVYEEAHALRCGAVHKNGGR